MHDEEAAKLGRDLRTRLPLIGNWIRKRAISKLTRIATPAAAGVLAAAAAEIGEASTRAEVLDALGGLSDEAAAAATARVWAESRSQALVPLIKKRGWLAEKPPTGFILSHLLLGRIEALRGVSATEVPILFQAVKDRDSDIAHNAGLVLRSLADRTAQDAVCQAFLTAADPLAGRIAMEGGYTPVAESDAALFLLLTHQWDRYEALDFDHSLGQRSYFTADDDLKSRLRTAIRSSARPDYLVIIAGPRFAEVTSLEEEDAGFLLGTLVDQKQWERLWRTLPELPLELSINGFTALVESGWKPTTAEEAELFASLLAFRGQRLQDFDHDMVDEELPLAIRIGTGKVRGRINGMAFHPTRSRLAIASGSRLVGVWDYERGVLDGTYEGATHSLGRICYTPDGTLAAAERTIGKSACRIRYWNENGGRISASFPPRAGSINVLEAVDERTLVSAGADKQLVYWNLQTGRIGSQTSLVSTPNAGAYSGENRTLALVGQGAVIFQPSGERKLIGTAEGNGPATSVAWSPDGSLLLIGHNRGAVRVYRCTGDRYVDERRVAVHHKKVQSIKFLGQQQLAVSAGAEGSVSVIDCIRNRCLGELAIFAGGLCSMQVSGSGELMAVGNDTSQISFWDLRPLGLASVLAAPLGRALPKDVGPLRIVAAEASLPAPLRAALGFAAALLAFRCRFDISVDDGNLMKHGEFDIEIEG